MTQHFANDKEMLKFAMTTVQANMSQLEKLTCSDAHTINGDDIEQSSDGKSNSHNLCLITKF